MKKSKVSQISRQFLTAVVVFSLIYPGSLWVKKEKAGAKVIVKKEDGQQVNGELLKVEENSLLLLIHESLAKVSIGIDEIDNIKVKRKLSRNRKTVLYIGGFLGGAAAGSAIGYYSFYDAYSGEGNTYAYLFGILGGVIGAVIGLISAAIISKVASSYKMYQVKGKWPDGKKIILKKLKKKARFKD